MGCVYTKKLLEDYPQPGLFQSFEEDEILETEKHNHLILKDEQTLDEILDDFKNVAAEMLFLAVKLERISISE